MSLDSLMIIHAAATFSMVGLIWFVQVVHYPLFETVGRGSFSDYEVEHQQRTTRVVMPLMLVELVTAVMLVFGGLTGAGRTAAWLGLALLVVIWSSTMLIQVPLHQKLTVGFDLHRARQLVGSNWIRTFAWSGRGLIALWLLKR